MREGRIQLNRSRFLWSVSIPLVVFLLMLITAISATPALAQVGKITENKFGRATYGVSPSILHPLSLKGVYGSPNCPPPNSYYLASTAVVSSNDIWAVGSYIADCFHETTLIEHWNGSSWSVISNPNPAYTYSLFTSVAVVSSNDVWAVGFSWNSVNFYQTLIEHWNGSNWSIITSPNPTSDSLFSGVAAVSSNDVWAVGLYNNNNGINQTLIEHWNGSKWSVVKSPNSGTANNVLNGVAGNSTSNVWAVGSYVNNGVQQTLTEHWNGTKWSIVKSPNSGTATNVLYSVVVISATDAWTVGYAVNNGVQQTLTEQWNGKKWSIVKSSNVSSSENELFLDAAALSVTDVWAMGLYVNSSGVQQTLTEHWNGTKWSIVKSPNVGSSTNIFYGGTAVSTNNVWAVGYSTNSSGDFQTLTEHWNGSKWSVVPSP